MTDDEEKPTEPWYAPPTWAGMLSFRMSACKGHFTVPEAMWLGAAYQELDQERMAAAAAFDQPRIGAQPPNPYGAFRQ